MDGEGMSEQDVARNAAFQEAWESSFTRLGIVNNVYLIAQSFYGVGWAAGVAYGRAEALAEVEQITAAEGMRRRAVALVRATKGE